GVAARLHRHWPTVLTSVIVLTLLTTVFVPFLFQRGNSRVPDSDQSHDLIVQEVVAGRKVALLHAEEGRPRWLDWPLGAGETYRGRKGEATFNYQAGKLCAARLLKSPGVPAYRFEALVRDESVDVLGEVGLFFALGDYSSASGTIHLL